MRDLHLGLGLLAAAGGPAIPLSGLALWLEADSGITLDGSNNVHTWADKSAAGNNYAQVTAANRPGYTSSGGINGLPAVIFSGNSIVLNAPANASAMFGTTAIERFVCGKVDDATQDGRFENNMGSAGQGTYLPYVDLNVYDELGSTTRQTFASGGHLTSAFVYDSYSAAGDWQAFINGTSAFSTGTNTVGIPASVPILGGSGGRWPGHLSAYIAYNRKLSGSERSQVLSYLRGKYGTP